MRLNELLGCRVVDSGGDELGGVADVRLVQDGPMLTSMQRALRIDGLVVIERRATRLLGYERHVGPALLRWLVHRRLGNVWYLPLASVERIGDGTVVASVPRADLRRMHELARY